MPKVAIIGTRGYPSFYGGFETAVRFLAPYLASRGWEVVVYGRKHAIHPLKKSQSNHVTSKITAGIESKSLSTLSYGLSATIDAARMGPDVALVMNVANGYFLPMLRARGVPILLNVDGIEWERAKWGRAAKWVFRTGAKLTARYADQLVFDAQALGARWDKDFSRTGLFIPYGANQYPRRTVEPGLTPGEYVLLVARFVPENTVVPFLEAALQSSWPVVIVGSSGRGGRIEDQIDVLVRSRSNVRWLGHLSDDERLAGLWENCGVYFHGHSVGGTNPALVQAMASGAPVLARDTVYNREVLGDAGEFVEPDPTRIKASIDALLLDRNRQLTLKRLAQARAAEKYTWDSVCRKYEEALSDLVRARAS
jgi:glycosyltransferase involved in cell wall biosynthesis